MRSIDPKIFDSNDSCIDFLLVCYGVKNGGLGYVPKELEDISIPGLVVEEATSETFVFYNECTPSEGLSEEVKSLLLKNKLSQHLPLKNAVISDLNGEFSDESFCEHLLSDNGFGTDYDWVLGRFCDYPDCCIQAYIEKEDNVSGLFHLQCSEDCKESIRKTEIYAQTLLKTKPEWLYELINPRKRKLEELPIRIINNLKKDYIEDVEIKTLI